MLQKDEQYQLVKAMVKEMSDMPYLPKCMESGLISHMRKHMLRHSPWACATEDEMVTALAQAREWMAGNWKEGAACKGA